jgi:hypothetical protein
LSGPAEQRVSPASIVVVTSEQVSCDLDGEAAILNLNDGVYYGLDEVGATIWNLIQQPRAVGEIRDCILEEYEVDPAQCEQDLLKLLSELAALGLVEIRDGSGG